MYNLCIRLFKYNRAAVKNVFWGDFMSTKAVSVTETSLKNERFEVLDIAKGIGILLVVFAHVNYTPFPLAYIYSFHMPLFFIISGMLFNKDKYSSVKGFIKRRAKTLICPYVLFYVASLVLMFAVHSIAGGISGELLHKYFDYFVQMFLAQGSGSVVNAPLWFVPCLFAVEVVYYFISKMKTKYIIVVCSILTFCGWLLESGYLPFDNTVLPWSLDSALFALGFYALGNLTYGKVKCTIRKIENNKYKNLISAAILVQCAVVLIPLVCLNGKISMGSKMLNNGFMLYATGIVGTIGILAFAMLLSKSKLLKFYGLNSFCIMSTHYLIRVLYQLGSSFVGIAEYDATKFVQTIIPFIVVTIASTIFTILYNKFKRVFTF